MLEQRVCERVETVAVLAQECEHVGVALLHDSPHLVVERVLRRVGHARRHCSAVRSRQHRDGADAVAHPPAADHLPRDLRQLLEVRLGAGRGLPEDELLGGRSAEELVFGQPSTGAESDLQQLTEIARQMVGRWGMSDRIGPVTVLPRPASGPLPAGVSDASQHALDDEVRRIVEQSHTDALTLLRENRDRLDALANALLEHETLGEEEAYAAAGLPEPGTAPREFAAAAFTASPRAA